MIRILLGNKLFLAPIAEKPKRILNIGTGTAYGRVRLRTSFQKQEIIGTNLSPSAASWIFANVKFEIDDPEAIWAFEHQFDFVQVRVRYLAAAITDWRQLVLQAYDATEPGGWTVFQDFDVTYYSEDGSLREDQSISR